MNLKLIFSGDKMSQLVINPLVESEVPTQLFKALLERNHRGFNSFVDSSSSGHLKGNYSTEGVRCSVNKITLLV